MAYLFNRVCDTRVELSPTFATYYRHLREFCDREVGLLLAYWILRTPSFNKWEIRVGIVSPIRHPTNAFRLLDYRFSIITPRSRRFINLPLFLVIKKKKGKKSILRPVFTRSTNRYYISVDSTARLQVSFFSRLGNTFLVWDPFANIPLQLFPSLSIF